MTMTSSLPRQLGPYRLVRRLGHGGMCEVFLARAFGASGFEKDVAVKVLLPDLAGDATYERLLITEARLGARLSHRNLVQVHDLGVEEGVYFVRLDYVDGHDLHTLCRAERPRPEVALCIAEEVALALDYLHHFVDETGVVVGLVHRDISPANVLLSTSGEVKLADFGAAKATRRADTTQANVHKGKYAYMSPEQVENRDLDHRSDLFSLGVTLAELLSGRRPFEGDGPLETMERIRSNALPDLSAIKPAFRPIVDRCLQKRPEDRYRDAGALYRAIHRLRGQLPPTGPPQLASWVRRARASLEGGSPEAAEPQDGF